MQRLATGARTSVGRVRVAAAGWRAAAAAGAAAARREVGTSAVSWSAAKPAAASMEKIKELRALTGAPIGECKSALLADGVDGDLGKAVDWLRKQGSKMASKKSGRTASEGLVGVARSADESRAAMVEVNSETDFVSRNEFFRAFVERASKTALEAVPTTPGLAAAAALDALRGATLVGGDSLGRPCKVSDGLEELVGKIRENLVLRRATALAVPEGGLVVSYVHNAAAPGLGSLGVLVGLTTTPVAAPGSPERTKLAQLGKTLALQVAATRPSALDRSGVDASALERERAVLVEQARASGKPENIIAKMVEGRLSKFYAEVCLLEQECVVVEGDKTTVKAVVAKASKELGRPVTVTDFKLFVVGEVKEGEEA